MRWFGDFGFLGSLSVLQIVDGVLVLLLGHDTEIFFPRHGLLVHVTADPGERDGDPYTDPNKRNTPS